MRTVSEYLGQDWKSVQEGIRVSLGTDISLLNGINSGLLEHPGKQIRPALALLMARACGGRANRDSIRVAIASELLHNATLLHDDVADESDRRRGNPTVRALMGPSVSVLVGDFWLVKAVRSILEAERGQDLAINLFSKTLSDLAEGEMLQLQKAASGDTVMEDYLDIIFRKTASLFVSTMTIAAESVGAPRSLADAAAEYGRCLGLAFQIRDDIFDYMPSGDIGKPVGVDVMERKITLPLLCAMDNVGKEEQERIREQVRNVTPELRDGLIAFVRANGGIEGAQKVLEEYSAKAVEALSALPPSKDRTILEELAVSLAKRIR